MLPCHAGTQCADAAANKQVEHEDGIAAVGGLWGLSQTAALVAKLVALCANIYQNDGGNESCISVSKLPVSEMRLIPKRGIKRPMPLAAMAPAIPHRPSMPTASLPALNGLPAK